ncbi:helix-turn-helix domain-containing protein [Aquimarina sp. Aq78]|uniref:winged helix-turn-helix transcriptional regulator n=1 Tax=Aquimarina sp. Aq78 TaxID=1191889 RepID=UPI000D109582|nr:helix-turn-helix domain-containing protein [Aquimarina sp. Aq78]
MRKENSTNSINERYLHKKCALNVAIDIIGVRWASQIIFSISQGVNRFHLLKEELPNISEQVLSRKLKILEKQKIIIKTIIPDSTPIGVRYILTSRGEDLLPIFENICEWGKSYSLDFEN